MGILRILLGIGLEAIHTAFWEGISASCPFPEKRNEAELKKNRLSCLLERMFTAYHPVWGMVTALCQISNRNTWKMKVVCD